MLYLNKQHDKKQMLTKLERFTMEQAANSRFEKDLLANYKNFISIYMCAVKFRNTVSFFRLANKKTNIL